MKEQLRPNANNSSPQALPKQFIITQHDLNDWVLVCK